MGRFKMPITHPDATDEKPQPTLQIKVTNTFIPRFFWRGLEFIGGAKQAGDSLRRDVKQHIAFGVEQVLAADEKR